MDDDPEGFGRSIRWWLRDKLEAGQEFEDDV